MQANDRIQGWIQAHKPLWGPWLSACTRNCRGWGWLPLWIPGPGGEGGQREWEGTQATGICNHDNLWGKNLSSKFCRGSVVALLFFFSHLCSNTQHFLLHLLPYHCFLHYVGQCISHSVNTVNICSIWLLHESACFKMSVLMW